MMDVENSLKITQNYEDDDTKTVVQPVRTRIYTQKKNGVIDLCEEDPLSLENLSSRQISAVIPKNVCEIEDGSNERKVLIEVTEPGIQANSGEKIQSNTEVCINNLGASELDSKETAVIVPGKCGKRGVGAQIKEKNAVTRNIRSKAIDHQYAVCSRCRTLRPCRYVPALRTYLCLATCLEMSSTHGNISSSLMEKDNYTRSVKTVFPPQLKTCTFCNLPIGAEKICFTWEMMDFCGVECLGRYQIHHGSFCLFCRGLVQVSCLGKYAVRIGFEIRQFCSALCLEEFKKKNKYCSYCQVDLTNECIRIPLDAKETFVKEFCSKNCVENHKLLRSGSKLPPPDVHDFCTVCAIQKPVEIQVIHDSDLISLCSLVCFKTFRFANSINKISHCGVCKKFFPPNPPNLFFLRRDGTLHDFCSKICHNLFILMKRKIVTCDWCKVKKFDYDMIKRTSALSYNFGRHVTVCSINCLTTLNQVCTKASSKSKSKCDVCSKFTSIQFDLIMLDSSIRHVCSYECAATFQGRNCKTSSVLLEKKKPDSVPVPLQLTSISEKQNTTPVNTVLRSASPTSESRTPSNECSYENTDVPEKKSAVEEKEPQEIQIKCVKQIIFKPPEPTDCINKFVQCKPSVNDGECQTDEFLKFPPVLPIPVPIYVPFPVPMYIPIPVPIRVTQPVPVLIPIPEKICQSIMFKKTITPADSSNGNTTDRMPTVISGNEFENISSESDGDVVMCPVNDPFVKSSSLNKDDSQKNSPTEDLVLNRALDQPLQVNEKTVKKRARQDLVIKLKDKPASNIVEPAAEQIKDDGKTDFRTLGSVFDQFIDKIMRTNQNAVNKRVTKKNDTKLEAKSAHKVGAIKSKKVKRDDGEKVFQPVGSVFNGKIDKIMPTNKNAVNNRTTRKNDTELDAKSAHEVGAIELKKVKRDDGEKVSQPVGSVFNKKIDKIMPTNKNAVNNCVTRKNDTELEAKSAHEVGAIKLKKVMRGDVEKVSRNVGSFIGDNQKPKSENTAQKNELPAKSVYKAEVIASRAKKKDDVGKVSRIVGSFISDNQKPKNENTTQKNELQVKAACKAEVIASRTIKKEKAVTNNRSQVPDEKLLLRKRTSESTAGPSNVKRSRAEHVTGTNSERNRTDFKSQLSNNVPSSSFKPEQANADSPLSLKVSHGMSIWRQWLISRNLKAKISACLSNKEAKLFSTNILKLTINELNYLLCEFVKEIRQRNGSEYAADSIYYLCLCIQQYLFQHGCINNIFVDNLYQPFINALDEVAQKFSGIKDTSKYSIARVEEKLLWDCDQLGGHSPYILLATLLFFNTKFFKLLTLQEHKQLSFLNVVRMKKCSSRTSVGSNETFVLRFYPPPSAFGVPKSHKKPYYEIHEDEKNFLRCPVKLFEFYLSKCPKSVTRRNDVFYLQPEGSCLLDSPTWFSTKPLSNDILVKMLHRIQMVKEIIEI